MADTTSLAIAGDWATGYWEGASTPACKIAALMSKAEYTLHLGDTYYAGTPHQVQHQLTEQWPSGRKDCFALPGNHEMYCKAGPFEAALAARFPSQHRTTFFAMRNTNWLVLALDSAYFAEEMYLRGTLGPDSYRHWFRPHQNEQLAFARKLLNDRGKRRVILFTHHPPIELTGTGKPRPLEDDVLRLFGGSGPHYWAWGHFHAAAVYEDWPAGPGRQYRGRLVGHGGIPFGRSSELARQSEPHPNPSVAWYECKKAEQDSPRVLNGFLWLDLTGETATERLISEDGCERFKGPL